MVPLEVRYLAGAVAACKPAVRPYVLRDPPEERVVTVLGNGVMDVLWPGERWLFPPDLVLTKVAPLPVRERRCADGCGVNGAAADRVARLVVDGEEVAVAESI